MKIKSILVIMSLLGTRTKATKLLKVPRIYNALITSDENLQPSQAYPALAPVVQGIQYPGYVSSNVYRMLIVPSNQVQYSDTRSYSYSVHNSVKEDYYHYNIVETGRPFKFDIPKITTTVEQKELEQPTLFRPVVPVQDERSSNIDNNNSNNRVVYFESNPVQHIDNSPKSAFIHLHPRFQNLQNRHKEANPLDTDAHLDTSTLAELNDDSSPSADVEDPKTEPGYGRLPELEDLVKNYRPKDTSIVDVPPPPIPISRKSNKVDIKSDKHKIEEYLPPPVGFF